MKRIYENGKVVLLPLTVKDANQFYSIYDQPEYYEGNRNTIFHNEETPEAFTHRIISLCAFLFTIRPVHNKTLVIGDCALHHLDVEKSTIEIGGTLFKEYRGMGYMQSSFELLLGIARNEIAVQTVIGKTTPNNNNAIRLAEKMGFEKVSGGGQHVILKKSL